MRIHALSRTLSVLTGLVLVASVGLVAAPTASAAPIDGATAKGRATGSGKWGYVGQFGQLNKTTAATQGQFFLPYAIDINGDTIAVTDSGFASSETGSKAIGNTVQTFTRTAVPGAAGHGDYLGNGQYDIVNTKSPVADPANLVEPIALKSLGTGTPRGPRGVVIKDDGTLAYGVYEAGTPNTNPSIFTVADSSLQPQIAATGISAWGQPNYAAGSVHLDTDKAGNTYTGVSTGVTINAPDGTFLSSMGGYFDADGVNLLSTVTWANRMTSVPVLYNNPQFIGEVYGVSVVDEGGQLAVYVGEAGSYYQPDLSVHFQGGATTAQNLNKGSITKFLVQKSGGVVDARWNPAGWKWTIDTSFGTNGVFYPGGDYLPKSPNFFDRFQGQTVFGLEADPQSNSLYYALNGATSMPAMGTLDLTTGAPKTGPAPVNAPSTQQDSSLSYVRGLAVDERGLVYATSQNSTTASTTRAIVQIFGMTPTSIAGTATAAPAVTTANISWGDSTVGYQQPDLLDYTVQYRKVGDTSWIAAPIPGGAATSTATTRTLTGLTPGTSYEARITPWNEAGSGDPALVTFETEAERPELSIVKMGNGAAAPTTEDAITVPAGSTVDFAYTVTNTGNVPLSGVSVADDQISSVQPPSGFDGTLAVGASVNFTASGPVAEGEYKNTATASSTEAPDASSPWHGFGATTGLTIVKRGNGEVATTPDTASNVPAGSTVEFTYHVTNVGNVPVTGLRVSDDRIQDVATPADFDGTLAPGATQVFTASGPVGPGEYKNTATAVAEGGLSAETPWHGFGTTTSLSIVKKGKDTLAPTAADAVHVPADSAVAFSYEVTNTGNIALHGVGVSDDKIDAVTAPAGFEGLLAPGESVTFTATGPVAAGAYKNTATATSEEGAEDSAVWHGVGDKPAPPTTAPPTSGPPTTPPPTSEPPTSSSGATTTPQPTESTGTSATPTPGPNTTATTATSSLPATGADGAGLSAALWAAGGLGLVGLALLLVTTNRRRRHG